MSPGLHAHINSVAVQAEYPHMLLCDSDSTRRLSKTQLWRLYWDLNKVKSWLYLIHCASSTGRHEQAFFSYLSEEWYRCPDGLIWDALCLVYV